MSLHNKHDSELPAVIESGFEEAEVLQPDMLEPVLLRRLSHSSPNLHQGLPRLTITESPSVSNSSNIHFAGEGETSPYSQAPPSPTPSFSDNGSTAPLTSLALRNNDPQRGLGVGYLQASRDLSRSASPSSTAHRDDFSDNTSATLHDGNESFQSWSPTKSPHEKVMQREIDHETGAVQKPTERVPPAEIPEVVKKASSKLLFWKKTRTEQPKQSAITDPLPSEMGIFELLPSQLKALVDPKSIDLLTVLGGLKGLEAKLHTNLKLGLSENEKSSEISLETRRKIYLPNMLDQRKTKSLFQLMWAAFTDKILIMLTVAAIVSLALGIYQAVGTPPTIVNGQKEPQVQWVEGVAIIIAIVIVVLVGALNDYQKELQFKKLNAQKEERFVKVFRNGGQEKLLNIHDIVVGDVLQLEPGEIIPVDGVFIEGHNVRCDESSTTGESDAIRKMSFADLTSGAVSDKKADCFILSGSKVMEGGGSYLAICVGRHSILGGIMTSLSQSSSTGEGTPLQIKLNHLADTIAKLGLLSGVFLFIALMIRFFVQLGTDPNRSPDAKAQSFINILIISVTIIVVAVPEGLPLAVTLALAFATKRMSKENLLVRVLASCETMANTTVVCTDKTGTLTQNVMTVVAGSVGVHLKFADRLSENEGRTNANDNREKEGKETCTVSSAQRQSHLHQPKNRTDFSLDMQDISKVVTSPLQKLFNEAIAVNSTAFEGEDERGNMGFIGSKTETALLAFAKQQGWTDYRRVRDSADIIQVFPFNSTRKSSGVLVRLANGGARLHVKGASEILQRKSNRHVFVTNENPLISTVTDTTAVVAGNDEVKDLEFTDETRSNVERSIIFYANQSLRTIAICYRDFPKWPAPGLALNEDKEVDFDDICGDLTLLGITAIEDPLRPGVKEAVTACIDAGVQVKMCTGDNVLTARSIATQCGIFRPGGLIMEGPQFRNLSNAELLEVLPRLQILARSSPQDKERLVKHLRGEPLREIVGVTGDGMNDAPALKAANVGFAMGIAGTEVAKEASDIVLMDDNFSSIVTAIIWGRCVNDSVRKFLQFQLSVNVVAVLLTFITAVASASESSVLTAVQLLWVNLIMDTFAALALATDPATSSVLARKPDLMSSPLITVDMWKMIIGQSTYQLIVALVLHWAGPSIFATQSGDAFSQLQKQRELSTLIFNQFVFCQIFNQLNCRILDRTLWVFRGFWRNLWFLSIFAIMVHLSGIELLRSVKRLNGRDWGISLVIGSLSIPLAVLIRLIPTAPCAIVFDAVGKALARLSDIFRQIFSSSMVALHFKQREIALPVESPQKLYGVPLVLDNLKVLSTVRGGRTRSSSIVRKSRSKQLEKFDVNQSALMAIVPSLVFSSIGVGWNKETSGIGSLANPAAEDPSRSSAALFTGLAQCHPDTPQDDPLMRRFGSYQTPHSSPKSKLGGRHSRSPSAASALSGSVTETIEEEEKEPRDNLLRPPLS